MKTYQKLWAVAASILILETLMVLSAHSQPYHIVDVGATLSGTNSYAHGINNQGQVVGYWNTETNGIHAFLYSVGTIADLGGLGLGGSNRYALNISSSGSVVGYADTTNGWRAFLYQNGAITNLGNLGGDNSYAHGINGSGQIVGYIDTTNGAQALLLDNGSITNLGTLGGTNSYAYAINGAWQVVGASLITNNTTTHAFLWQNNVLTNLNDLIGANPGWELLDARAINSSGRIAGWGITNSQEHGFLYYNGAVTDLGIANTGTNSYAFALNESNVVVGVTSIDTNGTIHAMMWENGVLSDLNDLIATNSGWELREARGINDGGQIVGWGVINSREHAFLMTPNLPPTVSITSPTNNTLLLEPQDVVIQASASDADGTVSKIEFYSGASLVGTDYTSPYSVTWTGVTAGTYALTAQATDDSGAATTSGSITLIVNDPPSVSITTPTNTTSFTTPTNITITASASDSDGTIAKVEIFRDATKLGEIASSPYSLVWTNPLAGGYTLIASGTDDRGAQSWSSPVDISVWTATPSGGSNLAVNGTASQSSTGFGGSASRAKDGNTNGAWSAGSVSHTESNSQAWWELDLGSVSSIDSIKIWNRTDCCSSRLSNFYLLVSDSAFSSTVLATVLNQSGVSNYYTSGAAGTLTTIQVGRTGRYVRVQLSGTDYLALAEVQVFAASAPSDPPAAPSNLVAEALSATQIRLIWLDNSTNETSFKIERKKGASGSYRVIASLAAGTKSFVDSGLESGSQYYYQVRSANSVGFSAYADDNSATTFVGSGTIPWTNLSLWLRADSGITADGANLISLWGDLTLNAADATQTTSNYKPVWVTNIINGKPIVRFDGTNDQLTIAKRVGTNDFTIFVVASTAIGHEIDTENDTIYSGGGFSGQRYLLGGQGYIGNGTDAQVGLSVGTNGVSSYQYARNPQIADQFAPMAVSGWQFGGGFSLLGAEYSQKQPSLYRNGALLRTGLTSSRSAVVTPEHIGSGTTSSGTFAFAGDLAEVLIFNQALSALDRAAVETYLNNRYLLVSSVPGTPTNVAAVAVSLSQAHLSWTGTSSDASSFKIERKTGTGGTYQQIAGVGPTVTSFLDTNLSANTQYYYQVRAANLAGDSSYSNAASATTFANGSPMPMSNVVLWLKADADVIFDSSSQVNRWGDQSGLGSDATQTVLTNRPLFLVNQFNGRPAILFDGTNDQLVISKIVGTNDFTIFAVAQTALSHEIDSEGLTPYGGGGFTGQRYLLGGQGYVGDGTDAQAGLSVGTNGLSVYEYGRAQYVDYFAPVAVYGGTIGSGLLVLGVEYSQKHSQIFRNGGLLRNGLTSARSAVVTPMHIGSGTTAEGTFAFGGALAEVLVFNRVLTLEETEAANGYLMQKYGFVGSAPGAPSNVRATSLTDSQLNLSWTRSSTSDEFRVEVERKLGSSGTYALLATLASGVTNFLDSVLLSTTPYYYRVRAVNLFGASTYSTAISPPTGDLTGPIDLEALTVGFTNTISAVAADADGSVSKVEFFVDGALLATRTNSPYSFAWVTNVSKVYALTIRATDDQGNARLAGPVWVVLAFDSDGDGLNDFAEMLLGTNPNLADTDGDSVIDSLDAFPLDSTRSSIPSSDPNDHTAPTLVLDEPEQAVLLP
jgi:probable HAF family extracellular repeat protein